MLDGDVVTCEPITAMIRVESLCSYTTTVSQAGFDSWPRMGCLSPFIANTWWVSLRGFLPPLERLKIVSDFDYDCLMLAWPDIALWDKNHMFVFFPFLSSHFNPCHPFLNVLLTSVSVITTFPTCIFLLISHLFLQTLFNELVGRNFGGFTVIKDWRITLVAGWPPWIKSPLASKSVVYS